METKINAVFKGQDGSCGYKTNKEYQLKIKHTNRGRGLISINSSSTDGGFCQYNSLMAFLRNWDNIRVINN